MTQQAEGRSVGRASVFHRQRGIAGACTTACSSETSQFGKRVDSEGGRREARLPQIRQRVPNRAAGPCGRTLAMISWGKRAWGTAPGRKVRRVAPALKSLIG